MIRQVEVDIATKLEQQKGERKEEGGKARLWAAKAKELAAKIAAADGAGAPRSMLLGCL